jgi:molybdopterin/thiamine biosynthesis adenylyltransferase
MTTLVLPEAISCRLSEMARQPIESAAVLAVGISESHTEPNRLLARALHEVPADRYIAREPDGLLLGSDAWVPALNSAANSGAGALFVHTHPGGEPLPSEHDNEVDRQLCDAFMVRTAVPLFGSVIIAASQDQSLCFSGRVWFGDDRPADLSSGTSKVDRLWTVGRRFSLISSVDADQPAPISAQYDRQVRAFGGDVQHVLADLHIGVAGAGGTGSALLEQLVRLGVRHITLIDPDVLSDSNITRVYGSEPSGVGMPKAELQAAHLQQIAPDLRIRTFSMRTTEIEAARCLRSCDVIFGCTDDDAGRIILSRLASYYLTPVIDCGVLLASAKGEMQGVFGRVTTMLPGAACLLCRNRVDVARAAAELMNEDERQGLQAEGYAPELGGVEPAVVPYTTLVAALAAAELLERLVGYGPEEAPTEILARLHDRELSTNTRKPNAGHFCDPDANVLGAGDVDPLLHWTWPT